MKYIVQRKNDMVGGKWLMWGSTVYSSAEGALLELHRCRDSFSKSEYRAIGFWDLEE